MKSMNFDAVVDRRRSESYKWREYPDDVIPLFVADMDFQAPEPVATRAARLRGWWRVRLSSRPTRHGSRATP